MVVVQQLHRLCLKALNDVLLAPQERMTMQTAVDGATLLQPIRLLICALQASSIP